LQNAIHNTKPRANPTRNPNNIKSDFYNAKLFYVEIVLQGRS